MSKITRWFATRPTGQDQHSSSLSVPGDDSRPTTQDNDVIHVVSKPRSATHTSTSSLTSLASDLDTSSTPEPTAQLAATGVDITSTKPSIAQLDGSSFSSSASRRVVVNNVKAVTNSDSEGLTDTSDDDLPDLDDIISRKRRKVTPPAGSSTKPYVIPDDLSHKKRPVPVYRHSLASIVAQHTADTASETRVQASEAALDAHTARTEQLAASTSVVDAALSDDEDNERVKAALQRIEAGDNECHFRFFRAAGSTQRGPDFPAAAVPERLKELCKQSQRQYFFTSGFAADLATTVGLPDEILCWIHDRLLYEDSVQVGEAYLAVLAAVNQQMLPFEVKTDCLLSKRYAGQTCIDTAHESDVDPPASLSYVLRTQQICSRSFSNEHRVRAIVELILLNADNRILGQAELRREISTTMTSLLECLTGDELMQPVIEDVLKTEILSKHQLYHAIAALPASNTTLHRFRRQLALHCVLSADSSDLIDSTTRDNTTRLLVKFKHDARFNIRCIQDWQEFQALVHVLDIAIDDGFSDFSFLEVPHAEEHSKPSVLNGADKKSPAEADFNKQIDAICKRLHVMLNNIKDGGTSSLTRTSAKYTLETLVVRLETCVRTKTKPVASLFSDQMKAKQVSFLESFLKQQPAAHKEDIEHTANA